MKTTSLEKLIKADLILQVQEKYSKSISKQGDKLDGRMRLFQIHLAEKKLREEREMDLIPGNYTYDDLKALCKEERPFFDPFTGISGRWNLNPAMERFISNAQFIDKQIMGYDREIKDHEKFKDDCKKFLKMKNEFYKKYELKSLLNEANEGKPVSHYSIREIKRMFKTVNNWKKHFYIYNRIWNATLMRDEGYFNFFERTEDKLGTYGLMR